MLCPEAIAVSVMGDVSRPEKCLFKSMLKARYGRDGNCHFMIFKTDGRK